MWSIGPDNGRLDNLLPWEGPLSAVSCASIQSKHYFSEFMTKVWGDFVMLPSSVAI